MRCLRLWLVLLMCGRLMAQDPQFTQFYASPIYLNPAFTGLTLEHRFAAAARNQWPGISTAYSTYMASYDYNVTSLNSGIGLMILQDRAGTPKLMTNQFSINYAYSARIKKNTELRFGLNVGMVQKRIDNSTLVFNDQLITGATQSQDARNIQPINYSDLGIGALYNTSQYWVGASVRHINQPNVSMVGNTEILPAYLNVHGGYRFIIAAHGTNRNKIDEFVSASVQYRHQALYDQLDVGAYYFKSLFNVGLWYRGLPYKKYKPGYPTRESVAVLVGIEIPDRNFRIGYSYDVTVSQLSLNNTLGAHEVTLVYEIAKKRKRTRRVLVSCPKF